MREISWRPWSFITVLESCYRQVLIAVRKLGRDERSPETARLKSIMFSKFLESELGIYTADLGEVEMSCG